MSSGVIRICLAVAAVAASAVAVTTQGTQGFSGGEAVQPKCDCTTEYAEPGGPNDGVYVWDEYHYFCQQQTCDPTD